MKFLFIRSTKGISGAEKYNEILLRAIQKEKGASIHLLTNYKPFFHKISKENIPSSFIFNPVPESGTKKELFLSILWFYPMLIIYLTKIIQIEEKGRYKTIILESMTEKLWIYV